jgi:adenylate cyclase
VSEEVIAGLDGFLSRPVGKFLLKASRWSWYMNSSVHRGSGREARKACETFADALGSFRRQCWDEARDKFIDFIEDSGDDGPARFYLKLCAQYKDHPPVEPWDGVVQLEEK